MSNERQKNTELNGEEGTPSTCKSNTYQWHIIQLFIRSSRSWLCSKNTGRSTYHGISGDADEAMINGISVTTIPRLHRRTTHKFAIETAIGVRCIINFMGNTGATLHHASTVTNKASETKLATNKLQIMGCDHGISSVVFKLMPRRRLPTPNTRVSDPSQSMRRILSYVDRDSTSKGSCIFTLSATTIMEKRRSGI